MKKLFILTITLLVAAQTFAADVNDIPDDVVNFVIKLAREHITEAVVSDGSHVLPETPE